MKRRAGHHPQEHMRVVLAMIVALYAPEVVGQDAPFSRLSLSLNVSQDLNQAEFQNSWDTSPAIDVAAGMPFYYGDIRAAVRLIRAHSQDLTDINSAYVSVGWGPSIELGNHSSLQLSASAGTMYMSFTDETVAFRKSESELAVALRASFSTRLWGPIHAEVFTEWQHAYTSIPVDFVFVSAGFKYDLVAPDWLRRFLD